MSSPAIAAPRAGSSVPAGPRGHPTRLSGVAAGLAAASMLSVATGLITAPLLGRGLGASGVGDLAAVTVPLLVAPRILALGIPAYAYRRLPTGTPIGEVTGSLGLPLLVIGLLGAAVGIAVADLLAGGREVVRTWLIVGFLATPLMLLASLAQSSLSALEQWPRVMAMGIVPAYSCLVAIGALYVLGDLTVAAAAAVEIASAVLALAPGLSLLIRQRPIFRPALARAGLGFGLQSWLGGLAATGNGRLDQLMMITAVRPRELGLYAVATTLASVSGLAVSALKAPLMVRIAAGESTLMAQAVRTILALTGLLGVGLAITAPVLLAVLFGPQFRDAYSMALILFAAQIPAAGTQILSFALQADGAPMIATTAEALALPVTVVGLLVALPRLGGLGAAIVSLAAYSTGFAIKIAAAHRRIQVPVRDFLSPTASDVRWARERVGDLVAALTAPRRPR